MKFLILLFINGYQKIVSPWLPASCRFYPTCSTYAKESIIKHGTVKGGWLTIRRLSRCHPFHHGGFDPVP